MITPRLLRRALRRGLRWRVLALWWASLAVPSAIAAGPAYAFLRASLDHSIQARDVVAFIDGATAIELVRQLATDAVSRPLLVGLGGACLALLVCAPFVAGAMVTAARNDESAPFRALLAGAGELYGRMLRTAILGLVLLGIGGAAVAGIVKLASAADERALTETAANRIQLAAAASAALVLFLCHLLVDAGRAQFAADPGRRSALAALFRGMRVSMKRPVRTLGIGALGTGIAVLLSLGLMALRLQVTQSGLAGIAAAWLLAQLAQVAVGWGRATRLAGLAELSRTQAAQATAAGAPAAPVVDPATVSPLDPP